MSNLEGGQEEEIHRLGLLKHVLTGKMREKVLGRGELRYNELTEQVEIGGKPLLLENDDVFGYRVRLIGVIQRELNAKMAFGREDLRDAILHVAKQESYHPFEEHVWSLRWDKKDRAGELAKAFRQAPGSLEATFLTLTMRAAVARATQPGVKVDTMLVLVGPQGQYKSTAISILGKPWFTDTAVDVDSKDSWELIHRNWFVEWGELNGLRRRDAESVKAFLSKQEDTFRAPYARAAVVKKRRCIFVGTTNEAEFLSDTTGNRRFWPVTIDGPIDVEWLRENRDQVFAQAFQQVVGGATHYLDKEQGAAHADLAQRHMQVDPWQAPIRDWLARNETKGLKGCSMLEILVDCFGLEPAKLHKADSMRGSSLVKGLGGVRTHTRTGNLWYWGERLQSELL